MGDFSGNGHYVLCPLCEGKGKMRRSEMAARLANHDVEARLTACRQELGKAEPGRQSATSELADDFKQEVLKGPVTRILWRRSPKE
jgi:hypothetical protein